MATVEGRAPTAPSRETLLKMLYGTRDSGMRKPEADEDAPTPPGPGGAPDTFEEWLMMSNFCE